MQKLVTKEVTASTLIAHPVSVYLEKMRYRRIKPVVPSGDCLSNVKQQHVDRLVGIPMPNLSPIFYQIG